VIAAILVPIIHLLQQRDIRIVREKESLESISDSTPDATVLDDYDDKREPGDLPEVKELRS